MSSKQSSIFFKFFRLFTELICWFQIMLSPTLMGLLVGFAIYVYFDNQIGKIVAIGFVVLGIVVGIVIATRIFRSKNGTVWFMSRIMATPDLDKVDENVD